MTNIDSLESNVNQIIAQARKLIERNAELVAALKEIRKIPKNHWGIQDVRNIVDAVLDGVDNE